MYLTYEQKEAIFDSFEELEKYDISYNRFNYRYKGKVLARELNKNTGNGYIYGAYLESLEERVDSRGWLNIKNCTAHELKTLITDVITSFDYVLGS